MKNWSGFFLALVVALVFALIGFYYLVPGVYHPFSTDTFGHTTQHLTPAAAFLALAVVALVLGRFVRPGPKA
jgi:uncharacterized membrane protein